MNDEDITVHASIRNRVAHDEPIPVDVRWEHETAPTYQTARDAIRSRIGDGELVTAWFVDR